MGEDGVEDKQPVTDLRELQVGERLAIFRTLSALLFARGLYHSLARLTIA
jgi:hypothetical protein